MKIIIYNLVFILVREGWLVLLYYGHIYWIKRPIPVGRSQLSRSAFYISDNQMES